MPVIIEYNILCPGCEQEKHRREFRRHGGGVNTKCRDCLRQEQVEISTARSNKKKQLEMLAKRFYTDMNTLTIKGKVHRLNMEFTAATRLNKKRLKALRATERKTPRTLRQITKRELEQNSWESALQYLTEQAKLGVPIPSLHEYMSRLCQ
jgi:hypothetical protein